MPPRYVAPAAPGRRRPWLAIGLVGAGVVLVLVSFVPLLATKDPGDFPIVGVPGRRSMELTAGRTYTLNFEYPGARDEPRTPPPVRITGPTGEDEPTVPVSDVVTYETAPDRRQGRAFATIHPAVSGVYVFSVDDVARTGPGERLQVTVGEPDSDIVVLSWAASATVGVGLLVAGVVMLVVRAVRRRRALPATHTDAGRVDGGWDEPDPSTRVDD